MHPASFHSRSGGNVSQSCQIATEQETTRSPGQIRPDKAKSLLPAQCFLWETAGTPYRDDTRVPHYRRFWVIWRRSGRIENPYQKRKWARCFLAGGWQGATKEDSRSAL
jgi:hypothetical protein